MKNNFKRSNIKSKEEIVMIESFNNSMKEYFNGDSNFITATWDDMTEPVFDLLGNANPDYFTVLNTLKKTNVRILKQRLWVEMEIQC